MKLKIVYSKEADKFFAKNPDNVTENEVDGLIIMGVKKILKTDNPSIDLKKLKGQFRGMFRIRKHNLRIIFSLRKEDTLTAFVHDIDFRGSVYR